jgi:hypothetical protein
LCMNFWHRSTMPCPDNNMRKARCKAGKSRPGGAGFILERATVYARIFRHSRAEEKAITCYRLNKLC